jgi:hypothetical protein
MACELAQILGPKTINQRDYGRFDLGQRKKVRLPCDKSTHGACEHIREPPDIFRGNR